MRISYTVVYISLACLALVSPQNHLSIRVTDDVIFDCNTDGFNTFYELIAIQIVKRANASEEEHVLAAVDSSGHNSSAWANLTARANYVVSGQLDQYGSGSWLRITLADLAPEESGIYCCRMYYMDHPADSTLSTWSSDDLYINRTVEPGKLIRAPGFSVRFVQGIQMRCKVVSVDVSAATIFMKSAANESVPCASWNRRDNKSSSSCGLWVSFQESTTSGFALEAHLPEVTCDHCNRFDWMCRAKMSTGHESDSPWEPLNLDHCPLSSTQTISLEFGEEVTVDVIPVIVVSLLVCVFLISILVCLKTYRHYCGAKGKFPTALSGITIDSSESAAGISKVQDEEKCHRLREKQGCLSKKHDKILKLSPSDTDNSQTDNIKDSLLEKRKYSETEIDIQEKMVDDPVPEAGEGQFPDAFNENDLHKPRKDTDHDSCDEETSLTFPVQETCDPDLSKSRII